MMKSKEEWKEELPKPVFHILWEKGTEPAFSGKLYKEKRPGEFVCAGCKNLLFRSTEKFESGSGWPSFYDVASEDSVTFHKDHSFGMTRTEVRCQNCGGHLGHVFDDGPDPTGKRYCINSLALSFNEKEKKE